ncbi:MAG TPA: DUF4390 domain-containing protein [Vicinamibacterales bacterium]|nr:DUF4390 domain-containing protein [Vicinamibacterales bacterium]
MRDVADKLTRRRRTAFWTAVAVAVSSAAIAADDIRIVPLVRDGAVLISFRLDGGYTDETRDAIASGLRTTFTYTVELKEEVPVWLDRTIASAVVTSSVQYDNLTRRHHLLRTIDGRVEEAKITEDEAAVREWLTSLERVPLFRTSILEPNREYYVRVRARARPHNAFFLWPWTSGPSGQVKFTFIP